MPGSEQHLEALLGDEELERDPGEWNDAPGFEEKYFVVESEQLQVNWDIAELIN